MSKELLIVYAGKTSTGSTATLAKYIAQGVNNVNGIKASIKSAAEATQSDVLNADGIICGSGDYNGNPEPDMIDFLDNQLGAGMTSKMDKLKTMPFGVFGTSAGYSTGVQEVLNSMARALMTFGCIYIGGGNWHTGQGVAGMTQKESSGGWDWANKDTTQKYLVEDACDYGRRVAMAALTIPDGLESLSQLNPNKCTNTPSTSSQPAPTSADDKTNLALAVTGIVALQLMLLIWYKQGLGKIGLLVDIILLVVSLVTVVVSKNKEDVTIRRNVAISVMATTLLLLIVSSLYGAKHPSIVPMSPGATRSSSSKLVIWSGVALMLFAGVVILTTVSSPSPGPGPGPPQPAIKCNSSNDCPNSKMFSCSGGQCVLKDKTKLVTYLDSVYPSTPKLSSMLSDVEMYNFFMFLSYYWLSYHPHTSSLLQTIDPSFPEEVACGGYFTRGDDTELCGSQAHTQNASTWPCPCPTGKKCCKPGSLSIPPDIGQLYYCDYLQKTVEVLRNGYDMKDTFNKSLLYDPVYLYNQGKLATKEPKQYLCILKDGTDGTGKSLSYKVCDQSKTYDFTKMGPGYSSNSLAGSTRDHGVGSSPDVFYYIAEGTGNMLNLGTTLRAMNKAHAALLLIRRAGELEFGSVSTYKMGTNIYTTTKTQVELTDGHLTNSFTQAPQLLLLECWNRSAAGKSGQGNFAMQNPTTQTGFGVAAAQKVAPNATWPFANLQAQSSPQIRIDGLLQWYFQMKGVLLPPTDDYKNNWSSWSKKAVATLGQFYDSITVPEFDCLGTKLRYEPSV